jgi:hypothetical protein
MGTPRLDYSFAGLREERELADAEKTAASGAVSRKVEPDYEKRTVKPAPTSKPKKGY